MKVTIDGERVKLPDDTDLTLGESEEVAKHLGIDIGTSLPTQQLIGLVFIVLRRQNPDGAVVDQVAAVRKMKVKDLEIETEEDAPANPLPVGESNGHSDKILESSGAQA
jgi:hypothetical protein